MTHRNELLALPLVLALASAACGDLQTPGANVHGAAYTSDGLVTAFLSQDLVRLDGELSAEEARIAYVGPTDGAYIQAEALSADGHVAAIAWAPSETVNVYTVDVFTAPERELLFSVAGIPSVGALHVDPSGTLVGLISNDFGTPVLKVYDVATKTMLWSDDKLVTYDFTFAPDGSEIYGVRREFLPSGSSSVEFAGLVAWTARSGAVRIRMQDTSFPLVTPYQETPGVSPDGQRLVSAQQVYSDAGVASWSITFWSVADGRLLQRVPLPNSAELIVENGAISADGHWAVETVANNPDDSERILVGDVAGTILYSRPRTAHGALAFSPDGTRLLMTPPIEPGVPGLVVYETATGDELASHSFEGAL
jgi:hypothetical protein